MSEGGGGGIFISYRRQDRRDLAGRVYDRLVNRFGESRVFMDVDAIAPGVDFAEEISRAVAACKVLLAVIGPDWLTVTDRRGRRRLDDPHDIVRLEIEAALARGVLIIPILAGDAVMPGREDLPDSLAGLARRNALLIRHETFGDDVGRLVTAIERALSTPSTRAPPRSPGAQGAGSVALSPWAGAALSQVPASLIPGAKGVYTVGKCGARDAPGQQCDKPGTFSKYFRGDLCQDHERAAMQGERLFWWNGSRIKRARWWQ